MAEPQAQNLPALIGEATALVLDRSVDPSHAAAVLQKLPVPQRALALASAFSGHLDTVSGAGASDAAQQIGRRSEKVLDELPDDDAAKTLGALIEAGDVELVLNMVRGHAGEASSVAAHLTPELVAELYENDPDLHRDDEGRLGRLLSVTWTLVMETPNECRGVNLFFATFEVARQIVGELTYMANFGEENALQVLHKIKERRDSVSVEDLDAEEE